MSELAQREQSQRPTSPGPVSIPFNRPFLVGKELEYIQSAVDSGHISGDGAFTRRSEEWLQDLHASGRVLLTTSCTHALELAAHLIDIQPGDEVIVPSFTFTSTVNAFVLRGARPVFVDIRPDTLNIDETLIEAAITSRSRVIAPVHYAGVACEMGEIMPIAERRGLHVVEDNAHGLFGRFHGRLLGTFGAFAALSFHETKNVTCGEGGALLINEQRFVQRAEILREKGTDRSRFFRGEVDKYTWVDIGSSYVPSELAAAFLLAQLERHEKIQAKRKSIWLDYERELTVWATSRGIRLPIVPSHCDQAYHMFYLLLPSLAERQAFIKHLRGRGILSVFHYLPLHLSAMGRQFGGKPGDCPVTEDVSDRLVRLPFYFGLTPADHAQVVEAILTF